MNTTTSQAGGPWEWKHGRLRKPRNRSKRLRIVVKIGGSLFSTSGWQHAVQSLIAHESLSNHPVVVLAGGGAVVNGLRAIDETSSLPAPLMHKLALEAMGITAQLLAVTLKLPLGPQETDASPIVLDIRKQGMIRNTIESLPHSWNTTSDSIAAAIAATTGSGLLLVKSTPPPTRDVECLASTGWVDRNFPTASIELEDIRWAAPQP